MFNTHHGTTNAVCMPAVLQLNAPVIHDHFEQAAAYLTIPGGVDGFCEFLQGFNDSLGIPRKLSELGVTRESIPTLVTEALNDPSCGGNPVTLTEENMRELLEAMV